ncbi:MAG: prenyltransferase/squalene oxidase repeat-containing protein [Planctomycetaceae bacterium]
MSLYWVYVTLHIKLPFDRCRFETACLVVAVVVLGRLDVTGATYADDSGSSAIPLAVAFLTREVPQWHASNNCYSCHNNADAVRALEAARRRGYDVPDTALSDSRRWLHHVGDWRHNGGEGEFNDYELAAIQFASALTTVAIPSDPDQPVGADSLAAIRSAAQRVASFQRNDGSWMTGPGSSIGSPATYGPVLATATAASILTAAGDPALQTALERSKGWLNHVQPRTVFDAAAILHARSHLGYEVPPAQLRSCIKLLKAGHHSDGGWGPYVNSMSEPFDTALVLLALDSLPRDRQVADWMAAGRLYLLGTQYNDGSWPETTRPAGRESYAQQMSTTAWVTLALLSTQTE